MAVILTHSTLCVHTHTLTHTLSHTQTHTLTHTLSLSHTHTHTLQVSEPNQRYIVGCCLTDSTSSAEQLLKSKGYSIWTFPSCSNAVITEFPWRSMLSIFVAPYCVYPALQKYFQVCVCVCVCVRTCDFSVLIMYKLYIVYNYCRYCYPMTPLPFPFSRNARSRVLAPS